VAPTAVVPKKADTKCKAGSDGKLPSGCKVEAIAQPVPAAKPTVKPEKTVSATN
jgi:hypothetical protein